MRKIDFLLIYEVKSREIENICLLKYELEKRGYTVEVLNTWYYVRKIPPKYNASVVISFALYNDETFKFISIFTSKIQKIVNLQWEQVGSIKEESNEDTLFRISGIAKFALNLCWGQKTYNRLKDFSGVDDKNLFISGHISLDFLRKEFVEYFYPRNEILSRYHISFDKKVCLFVSSFSYVNLPDSIANISTNSSLELDEFIRVSNQSQTKILEWIIEYLTNNEDVIFIYRPHPAEADNSILAELTKRFENFKVVSEHSIKQWILVSDIVYLWYSTSLAEVFYSGKTCHILRPLLIPEYRELAIYKNAKFLTKYSDFKVSVEANSYSFPVDKMQLDSYYSVDTRESSYIKVCNKLEEVLVSNDYRLPKLNRNQTFSSFQRLKNYFSRSFVRNLVEYFVLKINIDNSYFNKKKANQFDGTNSYIDQMIKQNYVCSTEITIIQNRIKEVLGKYTERKEMHE